MSNFPKVTFFKNHNNFDFDEFALQKYHPLSWGGGGEERERWRVCV